jgi:hypothetical protein
VRLWKELLVMKLFRAVSEDKENINVTEKGMFSVSIMMRTSSLSLNSLRETLHQ